MTLYPIILTASAVVAVLKTMLALRYLVDESALNSVSIIGIWAIAFTLTVVVFLVGARLMPLGRDRVTRVASETDILCRVRIIERFAAEWGLSEAERDVAVFVVKGFSNAEIADFRGSAVTTVKAQLSNIFRKSGLDNRVQLIALVSDEVCDEAQHLILRARHDDRLTSEGATEREPVPAREQELTTQG